MQRDAIGLIYKACIRTDVILRVCVCALKSTPALILVKTGKVLSVTSGAEQTNTLFFVGGFWKCILAADLLYVNDIN